MEEARTLCQGAIALIQSATEFQTRLGPELLGQTLSAMALHVLVKAPVGAGVPHPDRASVSDCDERGTSEEHKRTASTVTTT